MGVLATGLGLGNRILINPDAFVCSCKDRHSVYSTNVLTKVPIYLIYDARSFFLGSVYLRSFQLAKLLKTNTGLHIEAISLKKLVKFSPSNVILVFSKSALRQLHKVDGAVLEKNHCIADPIDGAIGEALQNFTFIVTTDFSHLDLKNYPDQRVRLIHHAPDWRLTGLRRFPKHEFCVYLGSIPRFPLRELDHSRIMVIETKDFSINFFKVPKWAGDLRKFKFHLTASDMLSVDSARPITKIATSVLLGALPIAGVWEKNAVAVLGTSYPFLLQSTNPTLMQVEIEKIFSLDNQAAFSKASEIISGLDYLACPVLHTNAWLNLFNEVVQSKPNLG